MKKLSADNVKWALRGMLSSGFFWYAYATDFGWKNLLGATIFALVGLLFIEIILWNNPKKIITKKVNKQ